MRWSTEAARGGIAPVGDTVEDVVVDGVEFAQLHRDARVARALRDVAAALGASLELDDLLDLVLGRLTELLEVDHVILFLRDERRKELVSRGGDDDAAWRLPLHEGLLGRVARRGRLLRVDDFSEAEFPPSWDEVLGTRSEAALIAPLKNNLSRGIGVLLAISGRPRVWSDDDEEVLSVLAKQASIAIDNSRLLMTLIQKNQQLTHAQEQLKRRVRDLELLFELERKTAHAHSQSDLAQAVLAELSRSCVAAGGCLIMREDDNSALVEYDFSLSQEDAHDLPNDESSGGLLSASYDAERSVLAPVIAEGIPLQLDSTGQPLMQEGLPEIVSLIAEPLDAEEPQLGALALFNKRGGPFTAEDLGLLRLVSANVSTAVRLFHYKRTREREERLSSIGRLLSQVVHDLKSPLTVISGYVQLMEESQDQDQRAQYAQAILKQFDALGAMQGEVLAFARGETQVFSRKVLLDRFLEELQDALQAELAETACALTIQAERKIVAHFDSERITRALQNLVRNAAEALGRAGGTISLEAERSPEGLLFRVGDDGPGIPEDVSRRLFQSFVTAGKEGGTGLGLAIVRRIVEEHGGKIRLLDQGPGAHFEILLPHALVNDAGVKKVDSRRKNPGKLTSIASARTKKAGAKAPVKKSLASRKKKASAKKRRRTNAKEEKDGS
ncbi:MAG: GAF domain-containing protein [Polyangiaceae bacterium]|nr:GAF domain-containing protein [Polyangiaceae bacterium]